MNGFMSNRFILKRIKKKGGPLKVLYISSYVPRMCGIATFTEDLTNSITQRSARNSRGIIAMNDPGQKYDYGPEVVFQIRQNLITDYRKAADFINNSDYDIVNLQHEFGIFGGKDGEYILELLRLVKKPVVTCLHTILPKPNVAKRKLLREIIGRSSAVIAMSAASRQLLVDKYLVNPAKIHIIHHGVPNFSFGPTDSFKKKLSIGNYPMLMVSGLIGPGKGFEYVIQAMPKIIQSAPGAKLYIVGKLHPGVAKNSKLHYLEDLKGLISQLSVQNNVEFVDKFLDLDTLKDYFQATDFYITPHLDKQQPTSGTLAKAIGAGKVCISTPYFYAEEMLRGGAGIFVDFASSNDISDAVVKVLGNPKAMKGYREKAYMRGLEMQWPRVAAKYTSLFRKIIQAHDTIGEATSILKILQTTQASGSKSLLPLTQPISNLEDLQTNQ